MMSIQEFEAFEQKIYAAAPLFFRFRTEGYFDPNDIPTYEDLAFNLQLGLPPFVPERRYSVLHYWGIECCAGWLNIVLMVAIKIESLLTEMLAAGVAVDDLPGCIQIKEKFGELQIYWRAFDNAPVPPSMLEVLAQAKAQATRTCSVCGMPVMSRTGLVCTPFCDECAAQRLAQPGSLQ